MPELSRLIAHIAPFELTTTINQVADAFLMPDYKNCLSVAVINSDHYPVGSISRYQLNDIFLKKYGRDLFGNRPVADFMNDRVLSVSINCSLALAAAKITERMPFPLSEDFIITDHGRYLGMGAVLHLLKAMELQLRANTTELNKEIMERQHVERELQQANQELKRQSLQDGLTGVANRRCFDETLRHEWKRAQRSQQALSLLLLDIDYFKAYNDNYGHIQGDKCLQRVAQTLQQSIKRPADLAARYGGEEFAVILPDTDADGSLKVGERIRHQIQMLAIPHLASPHQQRLTVSIGVATVYAEAHASAEDFIQYADLLLYRAKKQGRNCVIANSTIMTSGVETTLL